MDRVLVNFRARKVQDPMTQLLKVAVAGETDRARLHGSIKKLWPFEEFKKVWSVAVGGREWGGSPRRTTPGLARWGQDPRSPARVGGANRSGTPRTPKHCRGSVAYRALRSSL